LGSGETSEEDDEGKSVVEVTERVDESRVSVVSELVKHRERGGKFEGEYGNLPLFDDMV